MISTWYEILPVTLESNQVVLLRRPEDGEARSWLVLPHLASSCLILPHPGMHPNDAVLEDLVRFFGSVFEPEASIVHSTSWRYCAGTEHIILTYLVVLPPNSQTLNPLLI